MNRIAVITPKDAEHGFALAGVSQFAAEAGEAEARLREAMRTTDIVLVVIDERLMREIPEERLRELELHWHGVILALPSPEKATREAEDYAARMIRRAIGYQVRLNY